MDTVNKKNNKEKNITYKSKKKKRKSSLLDTDDEDSLKRYKSFYKEMNKIFGENVDIRSEEQRNSKVIERKVNKKPKIISDNYKRRKDFNNGNESNVSKSNQDKNNINYNSKKTSNKEQPIEHIYNNNFFTLSATKNIFMFTPNKDSIIYKHRKIKNDKNKNQNNENNPSLNTVKEIYSKPKIPYLLTLNKKREKNHNLFFSLQENSFKHHDFNSNDENVNDININGDKYIKNYNEISRESKYNTTNRKSENMELNGNINIDINKKTFGDNQDIKNINKNSNFTNSNNNNGENDSNAIFSKKRISKLMKRDRQKLDNENKFIFKDNHSNNDKKGNTLIFYRNDKKDDLNKNEQNVKNESKENKIDKIIQSIKKNDINIEDNKNKTFTEIKESDNKRRKCINSNNDSSINLAEKDKKKPIRIEEGEEDMASPDQKQVDLKEKNGISRREENKTITKREEEDKKLKCDSKKIDENKNLEVKDEHDKDNKDKKGKKFVDRRRKKYDKCIGIKKEDEKDVIKEKKNNNENNGEINKKEEEIKKIEKENYIVKKLEKIKTNQDNNLYPLSKQNNELSKTSFRRRDLRNEHKDNNIDNSKKFHFHNSENPSRVLDKNFTEASKNTKDSNDNNETKKFSIRNKYKMKKLKEIV